MSTVMTVAADSSVVNAAEVVHYQLKEWKAKHIHDEKKAETIFTTMKKLKIEAQKVPHNGHIDLKYRCVKEQHLPVKTHDEAMKWEKWVQGIWIQGVSHALKHAFIQTLVLRPSKPLLESQSGSLRIPAKRLLGWVMRRFALRGAVGPEFESGPNRSALTKPSAWSVWRLDSLGLSWSRCVLAGP